MQFRAAERVDRTLLGDDHPLGDFGAFSATLRDLHERLKVLELGLRAWDEAH